MFELAHPISLALIPIAAVFAWLGWRRPTNAMRWPGVVELSPLHDRWSGVINTCLWFVAVAAGLAALAGPRFTRPGSPLDTRGMAIMLVVDVSGSMAEPDFDCDGQKITRLEAVKRGLASLIEQRPNDRIGLLLFGSLPDATYPPTLDHGAIGSLLSSAQPRGIPTESETNIGDALAWALARLQAEPGEKSIVLFSDGEHNVAAPALTTRQAGQLAFAAGVPVHAVYAGTPAGPGRDGLKAVAVMTNGTSLDTREQAGWHNLSSDLDLQEKQKLRDPRRHNYDELYPWSALLAGCSLSLALAYSRGPGRVLP